jgi:phosphate/sulfate permease
VQFASCLAVLIASYAGFPVSTTHCQVWRSCHSQRLTFLPPLPSLLLQVGAIIALGYATGGKDNVKWAEVMPILGAWVITVPFAGFLSAALLALFKLGL